MLTRAQPSPRKQRLLKADAEGLTILNVTDPALPSAVREVLVSTARSHPEYFDAAHTAREYVLGKGVRLGQSGVFQNDTKLFELAHVLERVRRHDVVEVSVLAKHVGSHAKRGVLIGAAVGASVMAVGAASCGPTAEPGYCNVPAMAAVGAMGGGLVGLEYGTLIGILVPRSANVVYRRPAADGS